MKEPKISELEKLINHFRSTKREGELLEILDKHNIKSPPPDVTITEDTHEINPEALYFEKISTDKSFLHKVVQILRRIKKAYTERWYVRYGTYYVFLFMLIFLALNFPLILNSFSMNAKELGDSKQIITYQEVVQQKMEESAPLEPGEVIPAQSALVIPKIKINSPIIYLDTRDEKIVQQKLTEGVVRYAGTANPGEVGNTFIAGHSANFWWIKGRYNYVLLNLNKLVVGDQAKIYYNGKKYVYQVKEVKIVAPNDLSVLETTDTPTLTLMTCSPPGTNWKRLIVTLDQVAPKYFKPQVVTREVEVQPDKLISTDNNTLGGFMLKLWEWLGALFKD